MEASQRQDSTNISRRKAAKILGVSHATVNRDVEQNVPNRGTKRSTRALLAQSDQNDWRTPRLVQARFIASVP
jgi:hypothetical protein